jgi:type IIS restriction enzyme R and M protein
MLLCKTNRSVYIEQNSCRTPFSSDESWVILSSEEHHIRNKINTYGVPLKEWDVKIYRGILTGFNDAFIISSEKKDELIAADPKSAELIRPILRGRDVKRYGFSFSDLWLITTHNGDKSKNIPPVHVEDYPAIHKHLDEYYPQLAKRADKGDTPYNLRNCVYMNEI